MLKIGMPHMEGAHEIRGLRFWNGDPAVLVLEADDERNAMLLERCEPGTSLRVLSEPEQDVVIAGLLNRLWRSPAAPHRFRPLSDMLAVWSDETLKGRHRWADPGLIKEGLRLFRELPQSASREVLLATDLHAGNVLSAQRELWLVIDPKPFVGDPAYDATQHLFNCWSRVLSNPETIMRRFADLLSLDAERVRLWMFARLVAEPCDDPERFDRLRLARAIAL